MILQKLVFPQKDICEEEKLYYRGKFENNKIQDGNKISFNTYFNAFSIEKWRKYTMLNNLELNLEISGKGTIIVSNMYLENEEIIKKELTSIDVDEIEKKSINIKVENLDLKGIIYFEIKAISEIHLYDGAYITMIEENKINNIDIAICICTYKREEFLKKNIKTLENNIIQNEKSEMNNHLDVFIVDNAKTLDEKYFENKKVHYFQNKNVGGSGGFTRGIIEAVFNSKKKFSHIILMDDDITLDSAVIEKNYSFLRLIKKEYENKMIGGAMLYLEEKYIQSEAGATWNQLDINVRNSKYDLREEKLILQNENEDEAFNYNGWWYTCIPAKFINENNLPLPIFIHRDDVEYGIRNADGFILLNGICVWHPNLDNKGPITNNYYDNRNMLITDSKHQYISKTKFKFYFLVYFLYRIAQYKYAELELAIKGVEDFYKGIDNFKKIDGEINHKELMKTNYEKKQIEYPIKKNQRNVKGIKKNLRIVKGLFSYIMPQFLKEKVITSNIIITTTCFAKRITIYDIENKKAIFLKRDYKKAKMCFKELRRLFKIINKNHDTVMKEWNTRFEEITNLEFWKKYLDL